MRLSSFDTLGRSQPRLWCWTLNFQRCLGVVDGSYSLFERKYVINTSNASPSFDRSGDYENEILTIHLWVSEFGCVISTFGMPYIYIS